MLHFSARPCLSFLFSFLATLNYDEKEEKYYPYDDLHMGEHLSDREGWL